MGVSYFLVCDKHKEYVSLYKAGSWWHNAVNGWRPTQEDLSHTRINAALWFIWKHMGCGPIRESSDEDPDWWDVKWDLKEVGPYVND